MLSEIMMYLKTKIASLQYIDKVYGLAEIIVQGEGENAVRFTGTYVNGELQALNFDTNETQVFFLLDGVVQRETVENSMIACAYKTRETYSLKAILYEKGNEDINCNSKSQQIAWSISKLLTGKQKELMESTSLDFVMISTGSINLDKHSIWKQLYSEPDALREDDLLIEIQLKIETEGDEVCYVNAPCTETNE
jgi:hypothetical protein